ncbi:MAG: hypothetical protein PHV83_07220, partial [Bacteroidales bacterium]|nr:hypothetical protein [Bacteroidales bacterium]
MKDKVKSLHNLGLVQNQSLDFLNMRRADINYSNLFFAYHIWFGMLPCNILCQLLLFDFCFAKLC